MSSDDANAIEKAIREAVVAALQGLVENDQSTSGTWAIFIARLARAAGDAAREQLRRAVVAEA